MPLWFAAFGLSGWIAAAQEPLTFESQVELVEVPVWVVGPEGQPVQGLSKEDFTLKDNGQEVEIAVCEFRDYGASSAAGEQDLSRQPRQILILFDTVFAEPFALVRARSVAASFVTNELLPKDLVAVATISPVHGLNLVANFTTDRSNAFHAIDTLGLTRWPTEARGPGGFLLADAPPGLEQVTEASNLSSRIQAETSAAGASEAEIAELLAVQFQRVELADYRRYSSYVDNFLRVLEALAEGLRTFRGVKHVIFLSQGFHYKALTGKNLAEMSKDMENFAFGNLALVETEYSFGNSEVRNRFDLVLKRLSANSVVIHPIEISRMRGGNEASEAAPSQSTGQTSLLMLAEATGGQLHRNLNDLSQGLQDVLRSTRAHYVLGFYPQDPKREGTYHRLNVRTTRKGVDLFARPGYYEDKPFVRYNSLEKQFHLAEAIVKDEVPYQRLLLEVKAATFRAGDERLSVPVLVEAPLIGWIPDEDGFYRIEAYGFALDEEGRFNDFFERHVKVRADELARIGAEGFQLLELLGVRPGQPYRLRLVIRDAYGGGVGTMTQELPPADTEGNRLVLSPLIGRGLERRFFPLWRQAGLGPADGNAKDALFEALPDYFRGRDGRMDAIPLLTYQEAYPFSFRAQNLMLDPTDGQPRIQLRFGCSDESGAVVPIQEVALTGQPPEVEPGTFDISLQLRLPPLTPGDYQLVVELTDTLAGKSAHSVAPIRVVQ
ncbi:MAG TPA: VWA domain-containing protein [Acidobacteriota bacterium]